MQQRKGAAKAPMAQPQRALAQGPYTVGAAGFNPELRPVTWPSPVNTSRQEWSSRTRSDSQAPGAGSSSPPTASGPAGRPCS